MTTESSLLNCLLDFFWRHSKTHTPNIYEDDRQPIYEGDQQGFTLPNCPDMPLWDHVESLRILFPSPTNSTHFIEGDIFEISYVYFMQTQFPHIQNNCCLKILSISSFRKGVIDGNSIFKLQVVRKDGNQGNETSDTSHCLLSPGTGLSKIDSSENLTSRALFSPSDWAGIKQKLSEQAQDGFRWEITGVINIGDEEGIDLEDASLLLDQVPLGSSTIFSCLDCCF